MSGLKLTDIIPNYHYSQSSVVTDSGVNEIASRLKFIGRIQKGDKVDVGHMCIQTDTWYNNIWRTVWGTESRNATRELIDKTIKLGFAIISQYNMSQDPFKESAIACMCKDLAAACDGMANLKETYHRDVMFCCQIDTLIQDITIRLQQLGFNPVVSANSRGLSAPNNGDSRQAVTSSVTSPIAASPSGSLHSMMHTTQPTQPSSAQSQSQSQTQQTSQTQALAQATQVSSLLTGEVPRRRLPQ